MEGYQGALNVLPRIEHANCGNDAAQLVIYDGAFVCDRAHTFGRSGRFTSKFCGFSLSRPASVMPRPR
jgi:hypothetical protein